MTKPVLAFAVLCVVFGTTFGAIAVGLRAGWPPLFAAGARFTIAGLIVLSLARARGAWRSLRAADVAHVASIGLTVTAGTFGALYCAEAVLPSGFAALLSATGPIFAIALAIASHQRRLDLPIVAGIVLGSAGVAFIAGLGTRIEGVLATIASIGIVVSKFGFVWGLSRVRAVSARVPVLQLAGGQQVIGGLVLLGLSAILERRLPAHVDGTGLLALAYLAIVVSAGAHTLTMWLASVTNATFASSWTYVSPFIAIAFGSAVLHEPLGTGAWIGGAFVVTGAVLLNRDAHTFAGDPGGASEVATGV